MDNKWVPPLILILGVAGTGKTHKASELAAPWGREWCYYYSPSFAPDLSWMKKIDEAKGPPPRAIVVLDEIDFLVPHHIYPKDKPWLKQIMRQYRNRRSPLICTAKRVQHVHTDVRREASYVYLGCMANQKDLEIACEEFGERARSAGSLDGNHVPRFQFVRIDRSL